SCREPADAPANNGDPAGRSHRDGHRTLPRGRLAAADEGAIRTRGSVWLLMPPGGRIRFCGYAVSSDLEGHQVLTDQERAVIDRTDARSEFFSAGAGDLKIGAAVERDVREDGLPRPRLVQDAAGHLGTGKIVIKALYKCRR